MANCKSFPPVFEKDARVLVVGSMPGEASLRAQQYYAHPRNAFWRILFSLFDEPVSEDYAERKRLLTRNRIALWDVAAVCEREGSLDSAIRRPQANDFAALFAQCSDIHTVFYNGQAAWSLYHKLCPMLGTEKRRVRLPSTSPAYTMPFEEKLKAWRIVRAAAQEESEG